MQGKPHQKTIKKVHRTQELLESHASDKNLINNCATNSYISTAKACIFLSVSRLFREREIKKTSIYELLTKK